MENNDFFYDDEALIEDEKKRLNQMREMNAPSAETIEIQTPIPAVEETKIDQYFKLSAEKRIACFFDRKYKNIIVVYDDIITDDSKNKFYGYRDLFCVLSGRINDSIQICPIGQMNKRITSSRYIYVGSEPNNLIVFLKLVDQGNLHEGLIDLSRNFDILKEKYIKCEKFLREQQSEEFC